MYSSHTGHFTMFYFSAQSTKPKGKDTKNNN